MTERSLEHKAADGTAVEVGQSWAYRSRPGDALAQVTVIRLGTQRAARVLVTFTDEAFQGRQEWVPPGRLKARQELVDEFLAHEARWNRIPALPGETGQDHPQGRFVSHGMAYGRPCS